MDESQAQEVIARLGRHRAAAAVPVQEHAWLVAHGELCQYPAGTIITGKGEQARTMYLLLDGHVVIRADSTVGAHKIFAWKSGDIGGALPYSRRASPPNDAIAETATESLEISSEH